MSLTAMYLQESASRKFFMNSTYIMSRKYDSHVFGLRSEMSLTAMSFLESARKNLSEFDVHHV